jgi:hypothetical protein
MASISRAKSDLEDIKNTVLEMQQALTKIIAFPSSAPAPGNGREWRTRREFCEFYSMSFASLYRRVREGLVEKNIEMFGRGSPRFRLAQRVHYDASA